MLPTINTDDARDTLALGAYAIEDPILNPQHYPLDDRDPLFHARRAIELARNVYELHGLGEADPRYPLARVFDTIELAIMEAQR